MLKDQDKWNLLSQYPDNLETVALKDEVAWPCGFIAKFSFSDEFLQVVSTDLSFSVSIDDSEIAHDVDKEKKFIYNTEKLQEGAYWKDVEDQHLMVWYQMESLNDFVKLYGRIDGTMQKDKEYTITIMDKYASDKIGNKKYIYFTETGTFGGKNYVLAYFFGVAAFLAFLVLLFFIIGYFWKV